MYNPLNYESKRPSKKVPMTDVDPSGYGKNRNQNSSTTGARDSASLWLDYPTLSVLKIIFQIVGILALIGSFIVGAQTSSFTVFLSAAMGGLTFLAVPEIILILVRIESHLRELKDK